MVGVEAPSHFSRGYGCVIVICEGPIGEDEYALAAAAAVGAGQGGQRLTG